MKSTDYYAYLDHTNLKQDAPWEDIRRLCEEAQQYRCASVCVQPTYIERIRQAFPGLIITTVIGFPNGYTFTETKVQESLQALALGANELDMVINLTDVKNGDWDKVSAEIRAIRRCSAAPFILKVIVETCFLSKEEKITLCKIITDEGANFIKTSTGFGSAGATLEDIALFKEHIGPAVRIKAAGGIRSFEDIRAYVGAGCARIGASSGIKALREATAAGL